MLTLSKKTKSIFITTGTLLLMMAVIPLAIWVTHTQTAQLSNAEDRCVPGQHHAYQVIFANDTLSATRLTVKLCDHITFTNQDTVQRLLAFGPHEHHVSYDGVTERLLSQGQSLTITAIKTGTYYFHDHLDDSLHGSFTVVNAPLQRPPIN